jgi:hypothetical protein
VEDVSKFGLAVAGTTRGIWEVGVGEIDTTFRGVPLQQLGVSSCFLRSETGVYVVAGYFKAFLCNKCSLEHARDVSCFLSMSEMRKYDVREVPYMAC